MEWRGRNQQGAAQGGNADSAEVRLTWFVTDGLAIPQSGVSVADELDFARSGPGQMALSLYPNPTPVAIAELAEGWDLHPLLVEDLLHKHQRPKLDRYGDVLFLVVRSALYLDEPEEVEFAEFHILVRQNAAVVLCQDGRWIDGSDGTRVDDYRIGEKPEPRHGDTRSRETTLLGNAHVLSLGPEAVAYRLLDEIVERYSPVLLGLSIDLEQVERQVFSGDAAAAGRIYHLSQEVVDMQQASAPLADVLAALEAGFDRFGVPDELRLYLRDVADHLVRVNSRVVELRESLSRILDVNATLVGQRQNEDMKKISAWAAVFIAPTVIAGIYGMNFDNMPELRWALGYPFSIGLMIAFALILYALFKRSKWL